MLDRRLTLPELDVEIARAVEQRAIALDVGSFTAYDEQDHKIDRLLAQRALREGQRDSPPGRFSGEMP